MKSTSNITMLMITLVEPLQHQLITLWQQCHRNIQSYSKNRSSNTKF